MYINNITTVLFFCSLFVFSIYIEAYYLQKLINCIFDIFTLSHMEKVVTLLIDLLPSFLILTGFAITFVVASILKFRKTL